MNFNLGDPKMVLKTVIGVVCMTYVFFHLMALYGLLLGVGVALVVLP